MNMYQKYSMHIEKHQWYVLYAWIILGNNLLNLGYINDDEYDYIQELIQFHDSSKLSYDEFIPYARKFYGRKPNTERVKFEFREAVRRHKMRNLHHYESLKDYKESDWKYYAIELICDYIAMGWEFGTYITEYYDSVKDKIDLPYEYKSYIEDIIYNALPSMANEEFTSDTYAYVKCLI